MEIALYGSHHDLPFWHRPKQPEEMFDPRRHNRRKLIFGSGSSFVPKTWIWPVLMGLHAIQIPVMAHVSAFCGYLCRGKKKWRFPKRVWVQITTLPTEVNEQGIPVTADGTGKVLVEHLWGGDNATYTPYQLITDKPVVGDDTAKFWKEFFQKKLKETRELAYDEKVAAEKKADEMRVRYLFIAGILSKKPE